MDKGGRTADGVRKDQGANFCTNLRPGCKSSTVFGKVQVGRNHSPQVSPTRPRGPPTRRCVGRSHSLRRDRKWATNNKVQFRNSICNRISPGGSDTCFFQTIRFHRSSSSVELRLVVVRTLKSHSLSLRPQSRSAK